jgi:hypothetical protein
VNLTRFLAAIILAWTVVAPVAAAALQELERALQDALNERERLVAARTGQITRASAIADDIARLKDHARTAGRADPELESRLQQFDRLSRVLDNADARLRDQDRLIVRLRGEFDAEADAETRRVTTGGATPPREVASRLSDIDQAKRRVARLGGAVPPFRPVLDIRFGADDTVVDVERKLPVIAAERMRVVTELDRLARELSVLDARATIKARLLQNLEAASREAPPDMRVLKGQADDVALSLREMNVARQDLLKQQSALRRIVDGLDERRAEGEVRRRTIASREQQGGVK